MSENKVGRRFQRLATTGIFFQSGAAAVDTSTIIAALVQSLTGSAFAVGACPSTCWARWVASPA